MPLLREDIGPDSVATERDGCPPDDKLLLYVGRFLSEGDAATFSRHLDTCVTCRGKLQAIGATPALAARSLGAFALAEPVAVVGQRLGRFTLTRMLGRGGMGEVWAARDPELDREVALKLLRLDARGLDADGHARLRREAKAMARLTHPNIVRIYELGSDGDLLFCAMELVEGETLRRWLAVPRPWRETLQVLLAAGRGVAAAHAAGLVHRDVKPDNILIARDGRILVADFGLAKLAGLRTEPIPRVPGELAAGSLDGFAVGSIDGVAITRAGAFIGTPMYMPPELLETREGDALSDQFSFCVTAYEALYRARPFAGTTLGELVESVYAEPAAPPKARRAAPRGLWRCIRRGLAVDKEARWPGMAPLLDALERAAAAPRRRRMAMAAAAAIALVGAAVPVLAVRGGDDEGLARAAGEGRMDRAWNRARQDSLRAAFARAGDPALVEMGQRAAQTLDVYRDAWLAMRLDAWRATNQRKEQSPRRLEQRTLCLDRLADELDAFVQIAVEAAKPDELRRIGRNAGHLTPVATCADEAKIASFFPAAVDPYNRPEVQKKVELEEAKLRAAIAALPPGKAIEQIQAAIADAERSGVPGLSSGLLFLLSVTQQEAGELSGAEATLRRMIQEAARARRHQMVAGGWLRLMGMLATQLSRMDEALALEATARAAVAQAGDEPDLRAELAVQLGGIAYIKKDYAASRDRDLEAIDILVAAHGPKNEIAAGTEVSLAMTLFQLGELDDASRRAQHAHEILETTGSDNDRTAGKALMVLSWVARERKDWKAAAGYGRESVAGMTRLYGSDNLELAFARRELGLALSQLEQHDEAVEQMTLCEEVFRRVGGPKHPDVLAVQLELGITLERAHRFAEAEKVDRKAVEVLRSMGREGRATLGWAVEELARMVAYRSPVQAIPIYDEAMRLSVKLPDRTLEENVQSLDTLARIALDAGKARWALTWYKRLPAAAAKLPDLRRQLVQASRRR